MSKDITKCEIHITEPPRSLDLYSKRSPNPPFEPKSLSSSTSTSISNTSLNPCQPEPTKLSTPPSNQDSDTSNKATTTKLTSWWQDWWNKKPTETSNEPKLLDKYTMIKRKLGKGSTCLIQLVSKEEEPGIQVKYAVKVFYKDFLSDNKKLDLRVGQEFCLNSGLNHRNIVKVHDLLKNDQDNWCQVIEYCPAGDLRHIVQDGVLNEPEINCCFKQIMEGLSYIHSMGIAHRDIKPENILINQDCVVKIADFGCAKAFYDSWHSPCDSTTGLVGSEPYIAPELLKSFFYASSEPNDARSIDIWACGILYLAITLGRLPFTLADHNKDKVYSQYLETRDTPTGFPPFQSLKRGPRSLLLTIIHPDPTLRATMKSIQADPWYQEIELCTKGHAPSSFHVHYSQD